MSFVELVVDRYRASGSLGTQIVNQSEKNRGSDCNSDRNLQKKYVKREGSVRVEATP